MTAPRHVNFVPGRYRGVSVARTDVDLAEGALRAHFVGRDAYFKTRFIVARNGAGTAVLAVTKRDGAGLFTPIESVTVLAGPDETRYVDDPEVDTAIPSALAGLARRAAPDAYAVVVHGRYEHVNFILGADPLRVTVREVVPPAPAKLYDQARRILEVREDLPPIELVPDLVDLGELAAAHPAPEYLLPCRGSGVDLPGARVQYLDERPPKSDWLLLGCARSRQIHAEFYGSDAPAVDLCPYDRGPAGTPLLTKCCLQDDEVRVGDRLVSVPWGSSLHQVSDALDRLVAMEARSWQPA